MLWAPKGSSEKYHGPGSFAYRLYSLADPGEVRVSLVHGNLDQPPLPLFDGHHYIPSGYSPAAMFTFLARSRRWLAQHAGQYDVFHGLTAYHQTVKPAYDAHRLGLPAVVFVATHRQELVDKPGIRRLIGWPRKRRKMLREIDAVIAMSRAIYDELIECGVPHRRIARIPMGVNAERFRPAQDGAEKSQLRRQLGLPDRPTLLFVGAIIRRKQPHLLVEAVGQLATQRLDCQAVLVGPPDEGDYYRQIEEYVRQAGLEEHVKLVGHTPEIELYHRAADLFALPAINEGMPAALVEAMSCGLPCLGTAISGISDLIDDRNGRIVERTADSLAAAVADYLRDPALMASHGAASRARVLESYSGERVLEGYLDLFRHVIAGRDACEASTLPEVISYA